MTDRFDHPAGRSEELLRRWFPLLLLALSLWLFARLIAPFAGSFFAAIVVAAALRPLQTRALELFGGRQNVAAGAVTMVAGLLVVLPLLVIGFQVWHQIDAAYTWLVRTASRGGVEALVEPMPDALQEPARRTVSRLPDTVWINLIGKPIQGGGSNDPEVDLDIASAEMLVEEAIIGSEVLATTFDVGLHTALFVIALFFLLSEGPRIRRFTVRAVPLSPTRAEEVLDELTGLVVAVFRSTLLTALLQALIALIGFAIAGVPMLLLLTFLTFACSLIPAIGAGAVLIASAIWWWLEGHVGMGIFLLVWGLGPVGLSDNILKPFLAQGAGSLPGSILFFAMICGIAVFGIMGLVAGPLIVALLVVSLRLLDDEQGTTGSPVAASSATGATDDP